MGIPVKDIPIHVGLCDLTYLHHLVSFISSLHRTAFCFTSTMTGSDLRNDFITSIASCQCNFVEMNSNAKSFFLNIQYMVIIQYVVAFKTQYIVCEIENNHYILMLFCDERHVSYIHK